MVASQAGVGVRCAPCLALAVCLSVGGNDCSAIECLLWGSTTAGIHPVSGGSEVSPVPKSVCL